MNQSVKSVLTDLAIENLNLRLENAELREEIVSMRESNKAKAKVEEEIILEEKE